MCFQFQYNEVMESLQRDREVGNVLQHFCYCNVKFINNEGFKLKLEPRSGAEPCVNHSLDVDHLFCRLFLFLGLALEL